MMNQNLQNISTSHIMGDSLYIMITVLMSLLLTHSADQTENFSKQECSGTYRQVGGGGAMHGSEMKECKVVCQLLVHWCWRLTDWLPLRPTTTSAIQTRPVVALLCRHSSSLLNELRGISLLSLRGVNTEEAAAAASISAILQVFRT